MTPTMSRMTTGVDLPSSHSFITVQCPQPLSRLVAEQQVRFLTLAGADQSDDYECYAPQALVFVELEPAATSPFMDF